MQIEKTPVIVLGAKGIALAALEALHADNRLIYCLLDDDTELQGKEIENIAVLGDTEDESFLKLLGEKCEAFIAIENNTHRKKLAQLISKKYKQNLFVLAHPKSQIAQSATIGTGTFLDAGVIVGAQTQIGKHSLIQAGSLIDYQVQIGDFVQIGIGAKIAAGVSIGENAFIGTGATLVAGIKIGKNAQIGAGSVVISNVGEGETFFGNPAKKV
ncbi:NeuD/PglB/VioB family sugar acetyltransferase [Hugenholtzia roseola]|uniref:NeuD/PglB/VioB family sugar acetyltransferase n=1 Tax=Hugenholtzia roseola TaxID=1002 RepID=UPI00040F9D11|nr:NeuD/PglB/VioB family sugar acetyltransferase [Hugenholtzia roseola]